MKKFIQKSYIVLILIGLTCIPLISLLYPGLPLTHDGPDHVARIANFFASLSEGNIVPRWAANLNWGYGHPILMFLYPLSSYMASIFLFLGFSVIDSTKLVFGVSFIVSALTMYMWVGNAWGKRAGFIAALLYVFAPYRFVDLYVRGAIGEHVAFIFPPLICYFLYKLAIHSSSKAVGAKSMLRNAVGAALSIAALILSHNALSLMFLPVIGIYMVYLFLSEAKKNFVFIAYSILSIVLGFSLSSFFWVPAFFEGKYTLRDIVTGSSIVNRFVSWKDFFSLSWNYGQSDTLPKSIGIIQSVGIIGAVFILLKRWVVKKERIFLLGVLVLFIFSLCIQTAGSEYIWKTVKILEKFQFPWRFLSLTVYLAAIIGGITFAVLTRRISRHWSLVVLSVLILLSTSYMWQPKGYKTDHESYYTGIYLSTTDTGESSPIWSVRFMEHTPANHMSVVDGDASVTEGQRSTTAHEYRVSVVKPTLMLENTLFFPTWKIYIDGIPTGIQFQNPDYRGLMLYRITEGEHTVRVVFEDTMIRKSANMISAVSFGFLGLLLVGGFVWKKRR